LFSSNLNRNITEFVIDTFINLYHSLKGFVNITLIKVNIKNNKLHIVIKKKLNHIKQLVNKSFI